MKAPIAKPVNDTQRAFNELCEKGGGVRGGPAAGKVIALLRESGQQLSEIAYREAADHLAAFPDANPWHVCYAVALAWGHLAKLDLEFTGAVVRLLADWNNADLEAAKSFHLERGPTPIEQSLIGAHTLFRSVALPKTLPDSLERLGRAQERWLSPVLNPATRPRYIGAWNGTAMFMVALFAQPSLAKTQRSGPPALPPGGPIHMALQQLHLVGITKRPPAANALDDEAFEPGVIYEDNELFAELCRWHSDWCLIDVHSGLYNLGTRDKSPIV